METLDIFSYERIIIIGNNGSGKSYLCEKLSKITNLPAVHLDAEYWRPNWEQPSKDEWEKRQIELIAKDKWIIDGNHTNTLELRFKAAEAIIFLDINRPTCLFSVLKRHGKKRCDLPQFLEEKIDKDFFRFLKGLWSFSKTRRNVIVNLHNVYSDKPFFLIKSRKKINLLLNQWKEQTVVTGI